MSDIIMSENLIDDQSDHDENYLEDKILTQALPVTELKKDIDLNIPPATGEDYLSRVRYEASKISKVVVANVDVKKFEKNRTTQYFQPVCLTLKIILITLCENLLNLNRI